MSPGVVAHGVGGGGAERRRGQPAVLGLRCAQENLVRVVVVVADDDVGAPVAVQVGEQHRQRLGGGRQQGQVQTAVRVLVVGHAAADGEAVAEVGQLAVVAAGHQVEVAVAVQVGPAHGVGDVAGAQPRHALKPVVGGGVGAGRPQAEPQRRRRARMGEGQVEPAVAVEVDGVDRPRGAGSERLGTELHLAVVPIHRARTGKVGEHQVQVAVVVQVAHRQAGADGVEVGDPPAEPLDAVVQVDGREAAAARCRLGQRGNSMRRRRRGDGERRRIGRAPGQHRQQQQGQAGGRAHSALHQNRLTTVPRAIPPHHRRVTVTRVAEARSRTTERSPSGQAISRRSGASPAGMPKCSRLVSPDR